MGCSFVVPVIISSITATVKIKIPPRVVAAIRNPADVVDDSTDKGFTLYTTHYMVCQFN